MKKTALLTAIMLITAAAGMTACHSAADTAGTQSQPQESSESPIASSGSAGAVSAKDTGSAANGETNADAQAEEYLGDVIEAIEAQYPGETFTPISGKDIDTSSSLFAKSYRFGGGRSGSGWEFVVGVCTTKENPLEGLTCSTGRGIPGYTLSQFDDGKLLLLEKGDSDSSRLSFLYDALEQGTAGTQYMKEAAGRGVSLVPPLKGPFLRTSMVKNGYSTAEFLPLKAEQAAQLESGKPAAKSQQDEAAAVMLLKDRAGLAVGTEAPIPVTQEMITLAEQKCGLQSGSPEDISKLTKATMTLDLYGEIRVESTENRDDLDLLAAQFEGAAKGDDQSGDIYSGVITMTKQDGSQVTVQMSPSSGNFIVGNASYYSMSEKKSDAVWAVFNTLDGWRRYGSKIRIRMTQDSYPLNVDKLTFTLENETGKSIQYILSPILYKEESQKDENGAPVWKRIDSIAGFCGFLSPLDQESIKLEVPWNGSFVPEGPGTYKLEIQVVPENDLRYEISDTFELTQ